VNANPRTRYAAAVHRACVDGNLPLVRRLFAEASGEVFTLRGLLAREDEIVLGRVLAARYLAGASLLALSAEIGRSTQYVAKVLRLAGVVIRPPYRPVRTSCPVNLVELRRRYEAGASVAGLARQIHYCRESTRKFLLMAGAELRTDPAGQHRVVTRLAGATQPDAWMARASPFFSLPQSELRYPAAKTGPASDRAGVSGGPLRGGR